MWDTVTAHYLSNPLVYFDPINEAHRLHPPPSGWDFAATWIARENAGRRSQQPAVHRGRAAGWRRLGGVTCDRCATTPASTGSTLAMHRYAFSLRCTDLRPVGQATLNHPSWATCSARTVIEEFGRVGGHRRRLSTPLPPARPTRRVAFPAGPSRTSSTTTTLGAILVSCHRWPDLDPRTTTR